MNVIVASLITLGVIGLVAAIVLYFVAQKFKVEEDPRIDEVESVLPGANCGGCGFPGCHGFADACVKSPSLDGKLCPVGGQPVMSKIATILGMSVADAKPKVAVVRCNGSCANRPKKNLFDGAKSCRISNQLYAGETGCSFGCLGYGDCVDVCKFDAIKINPDTGLPEVDDDKCTACGACAKICPKRIIELRDKGVKNRRVFVSCVNKDKGAVARKACSAACIGCGLCAKNCPFNAIKVENNLAYIDFNLCRLCRKCVAVCPTGAIHDVNFPTPVPPAQKNTTAAKPLAKPADSANDINSTKTDNAAVNTDKKSESQIESNTNNAPVIEIVAKKEVVAEKEVVTEKEVVAENKKQESAPETSVAPDTIKGEDDFKAEPKVDSSASQPEAPASEKDGVEITIEKETDNSKEAEVEIEVIDPRTDNNNDNKESAPSVKIEVEENKTVTKASVDEKTELPQSDAAPTNKVDEKNVDDVSQLIDPEMRVVPREKKDKKSEKPTAEQQTLF